MDAGFANSTRKNNNNYYSIYISTHTKLSLRVVVCFCTCGCMAVGHIEEEIDPIQGEEMSFDMRYIKTLYAEK